MFHLLLALYGIVLYTAPFWLAAILLVAVFALLRKGKKRAGQTPEEKESWQQIDPSTGRKRTPPF